VLASALARIGLDQIAADIPPLTTFYPGSKFGRGNRCDQGFARSVSTLRDGLCASESRSRLVSALVKPFKIYGAPYGRRARLFRLKSRPTVNVSAALPMGREPTRPLLQVTFAVAMAGVSARFRLRHLKVDRCRRSIQRRWIFHAGLCPPLSERTEKPRASPSRSLLPEPDAPRGQICRLAIRLRCAPACRSVQNA
jgi:hypothetical protein